MLGQGPEGSLGVLKPSCAAWSSSPALSRGVCPRSLPAEVFSVDICVIYAIYSQKC